MARPCTFGIEEEYLLLVLASGDVLDKPSKRVLDACQAALGEYYAAEMFRSQIEIASPIFSTSHQARTFFTQRRQALSHALAEHGVAPYGAASHPCAQWQRQQPATAPHHRQLFADYQHVARRSLLSGLHVHVGVPEGCDRMQVINRVQYWLPLLLLLSTSSPFWCGQDTGYMSYRRVICGEWPHMGLPEALPDWNAYQRYRALLQRTGSLAADGDFWWAVRPSRRYPTVELRIGDACPRLEDALAIAGLFRHLVEHAVVRHRKPQVFDREWRWITQENYWRASRLGRDGTYIGLDDQQAVGAQDWLAQLQGQYPVDSADAERALLHARRILAEGTSADRQRQVYQQAVAQGLGRHQAWQAVVRQVLHDHRSVPDAD